MRILSVFALIASCLILPAQQIPPESFHHELTRTELRAAKNITELVPALDKSAFVIRAVMLTRVKGKAAQINNPGPVLSEETRILLARADFRSKIFGDLQYTLAGDTTRLKRICAFVIQLKD